MKNLSATETPRQLGFHMPAEWEAHTAVYLSWPHDEVTFPQLKHVEKAYVHWIRELTADPENEHVNLFVRDNAEEIRIAALLKAAGARLERISFIQQDYADVWIRDYGPTFVVNRSKGELAMVDWRFNAWGDKYEILLKDDQIPQVIEKRSGYRRFSPGIVMEGGSIEVNGDGVLLTTEQCLLNKNRNPHLKREEIEEYLKEYTNVSKIIWLKEGIEGDDTDGHIDDIARFTDENTIVACYEEDQQHPNHALLEENYQRLLTARDAHGNPFRVVKIPMPDPVESSDGPLPASYVNFYIANKTLFVPLFGGGKDQEALFILKNLFPNRKTVGILARDFVFGLGTLHCASQQQPKI